LSIDPVSTMATKLRNKLVGKLTGTMNPLIFRNGRNRSDAGNGIWLIADAYISIKIVEI